MVRYYGRARQRIGSVNTNQPGLTQAGCPGTVGKQGKIIRFLGRRVNCNMKTCGLPMSGLRCRYGVANAIGYDKTASEIQYSKNPAIKNYCEQIIDTWNGNFCQWPQPRNRQNAGGVGHIWTSRRSHCEKTCSASWQEIYMLDHSSAALLQATCLEQIYGTSQPDINSLNFIYLSPTCKPLLHYFENKSGAQLQIKKGNEKAAFPPSFSPLTATQFQKPTLLIPKLYQPWYPLFYSENKVAAINKYYGGGAGGGGTWNQLFADNLNGWKGLVEIANHGGKDALVENHGFWWFYRAVGSGIFVDLGQNPLVAMNKAHALTIAYPNNIPSKDISCADCSGGTTCGPDGSYNTIDDYLSAAIYIMEDASGVFKFGAELTFSQWSTLKKYVKNQYGDSMDSAKGFANILTKTNNSKPSYFTDASSSTDYRDILAHGVLGTSLSSPPVDIDCRLMQILVDTSHSSIQMLCQPNYQGGWTTEILYKAPLNQTPIFYNAQGQVCPIPKPDAADCLFCNQPSIDVGCNT